MLFFFCPEDSSAVMRLQCKASNTISDRGHPRVSNKSLAALRLRRQAPDVIQNWKAEGDTASVAVGADRTPGYSKAGGEQIRA